jgi:hypothetical protein
VSDVEVLPAEAVDELARLAARCSALAAENEQLWGERSGSRPRASGCGPGSRSLRVSSRRRAGLVPSRSRPKLLKRAGRSKLTRLLMADRDRPRHDLPRESGTGIVKRHGYMEASGMTQYGGDRSVRRMALRVTARGLGMQQRLFGPDIQGLAPVSDAGLGRVLRDLPAASELQSFRIWLVGSRLEPGRTGSDIDLVLSPRPGTLPSEHLIEHALWYCREYGLYGATPACVIDPCFRAGGPTVALVPLRPHVRIKTVKLLSPRLADLVTRGRIPVCRRVGDVGIEFVRRAEDTDYFGKLPRGDFDGSRWPYLRPAIEIVPADNDDLSRAIHASRQ